MIRTLAQKIQSGLKFFLGHGESNSNINRESVGEVLSSFTKDIKGKLSNIIVGWFPNKEKVQAMDTCSMEADIHTDEAFVVGDINEVTGIALGNSDQDHPAFPGALRLSMVQCFTELEPDPKSKEGDPNMPEPEPRKLTMDDVKRAIQDMNIFPWQVFSLEQFKNDQNLKKIFEENTTLKAENERLSKENKEITEKSAEAVRKSEVSGGQERLDALLKEGYTDKQKQFIKADFSPENTKDLSDEGLKKFLDNSKKKFAEQAKLFGAEKLVESGTDEEIAAEEEEKMEDEALKIMRGDETKATDKS